MSLRSRLLHQIQPFLAHIHDAKCHVIIVSKGIYLLVCTSNALGFFSKFPNTGETPFDTQATDVDFFLKATHCHNIHSVALL